jgi:crotonobetainyl-CoA:carnitine CoA-transferase CaiB-like acyl-CoA transferase
LVWAGPHCGRLLAGLGATVVKVEAPQRPDGPRPPDGWDGCSGAFGDLNRGKRSLAIDLVAAAGRKTFLRLVAGADVLVENFSPRVMPNFGFDMARLSRVSPRLVSLAMPAFGSDGPWANAVSYGSGLELATGLWDLDENGVPSPAPVPYLDYLASVSGAAAIVAALLAREVSGQGMHVEVAQREVACQLLVDGPPRQRGPALRIDAAELAHHPALADFVDDSGGRGDGVTGLGEEASHACWHFTRLPWRMYDVPSPREGPAPELGQDSASVLHAMGRVDRRTIQRLIRDGVVLDAEHSGRGTR